MGLNSTLNLKDPSFGLQCSACLSNAAASTADYGKASKAQHILLTTIVLVCRLQSDACRHAQMTHGRQLIPAEHLALLNINRIHMVGNP